MRATVEQRLEELRQHRVLLVERAELQRGELGRVFAEFEQPLHWFNWGLMAAGWLRSSPVVASASAAGALLVLGKVRHWIGRALMVWELFTALRRHLPERHEVQVNEERINASVPL
jgi:hypothetical protein